jgi:hypothetical protein
VEFVAAQIGWRFCLRRRNPKCPICTHNCVPSFNEPPNSGRNRTKSSAKMTAIWADIAQISRKCLAEKRVLDYEITPQIATHLRLPASEHSRYSVASVTSPRSKRRRSS